MIDGSDGDRRSEYRHKICIDVSVITPDTSFWAVATNISGGGLEIRSTSIISPKTKLMISFQLQENFVFNGTVIWTLSEFVNGRWVYRIGIRTEDIAFKNMFATSTEEKAELVKRILPQIKVRGAGIGISRRYA